jgi:hypothetical protein
MKKLIGIVTIILLASSVYAHECDGLPYQTRGLCMHAYNIEHRLEIIDKRQQKLMNNQQKILDMLKLVSKGTRLSAEDYKHVLEIQLEK